MRTKRLVTVVVVAVLLGAAFMAARLIVQDRREAALARAADAGDIDSVKRCVESGVNLNRGSRQADGSRGLPPLTVAALAGHEPVVRYLLDRGANPNLRGMSNPLIAACWKRHYDVAKLLLERGADPNVRGEGTPLYAAESTSQPELVSLLREHGAHK